jgi:hypothetical protein
MLQKSKASQNQWLSCDFADAIRMAPRSPLVMMVFIIKSSWRFPYRVVLIGRRRTDLAAKFVGGEIGQGAPCVIAIPRLIEFGERERGQRNRSVCGAETQTSSKG